MTVTLQDVARRAGVSPRTVSRVVNQQGEISEATRARIQSVIDELGYRPNYLARSLVSQRSHMLGVAAWGLDYYAPSRIVVSIEQRSRELGYALFLHLLPNPADHSARRIIDTLAAHRVEGIIWAIPEVGDNRAWLSPSVMKNLPPIVFMNMQAQAGLPSVSVDNRKGGYKATTHLLSQGRRKIGLICGPANWWEAQERYAGWREALQQAGIAYRPAWIALADWSVESGARAMAQLLEQAPDLDAVFAASDDIALGALAALQQAGRRVPGDVAVVGFDDTPQSAYFQPPLTTLRQPLAEIGCQAVELLQRRIERKHAAGGAEETAVIIQEPELVVRASSLEDMVSGRLPI